MSKKLTVKRSAPPITDTSDAEQIKKAQDHERSVEADLGWLMSQPRGRRYIHKLIYEVAHKDAPSHVPNDPNSTAYNEGARSIGVALEEELRAHHFDAFITMLEENHG